MKYFILITFLTVSIYSQKDSIKNKDEFKSEFSFGVGLTTSSGYDPSFAYGADLSHHFGLGYFGSIGINLFTNLVRGDEIVLADLQVRKSFNVENKTLITFGAGCYLGAASKGHGGFGGGLIFSGKLSYIVHEIFTVGIETKFPFDLYRNLTLITKLVLGIRL